MLPRVLLSLPRPPLPSLTPLIECVAAARRLVVLTGAGCSTESGIPDYRSPRATPRTAPMRYVEFTRSAEKRQRYWARAVVGWAHVGQAQPNAAHHALAALEAQGKISMCITQNVDGLHQAAGSARVIELHGALGEVICLDCEQVTARRELQARMQALNPGWLNDVAVINPDGDASISRDPSRFVVPACQACGGALKPRVVFFGERVPPPRVAQAFAAVDDADALLVAGTSLQVWSGLRFVRRAAERGLPIALVNLGPTRADELATVRIDARVGDVLPALVEGLRACRA